MGWLIDTKFLLQMMPFSPSMHKPQAATFPWSAAAPVRRAPGPRQWELLSRAHLLPFLFLLSLCSPENCVFQVQIPGLGPRSTPSSEWVFRNNGLFLFFLIIIIVVVIVIIIITLFNVTFCLGVHFLPISTSQIATKAGNLLCTPLLMPHSLWPWCSSVESGARVSCSCQHRDSDPLKVIYF